MRPLTYAVMLAVLTTAAVGFLTSSSLAQDEPQNLVVTITDSGISADRPGPYGGLYNVTVHNTSSSPRGIVMTGIDRGVSPFVRFTPVLGPGQQVSFQWYFPRDRVITMKDLLFCEHSARSCAVARVGGMAETLTFT